MNIKRITRYALIIICIAAFIIQKDSFFLGLAGLAMISYMLIDEIYKLEKRIKKLEKQR